MSAILKNNFQTKAYEMCKVLTKIGQLGIVQDTSVTKYNGYIVLRTYNAFVSLTDPSSTWNNIHDAALKVIPLPAGTVVEFVSEV